MEFDIFQIFEWENTVDNDDIDQVKTKFAAYFAPKRNVTYERYTFMKRIWKIGEPFDTYVTDLRNIIRTNITLMRVAVCCVYKSCSASRPTQSERNCFTLMSVKQSLYCLYYSSGHLQKQRNNRADNAECQC